MERNWEENNPAIYNLLTSYCTLAMKNRLESMDGYDEVKDEQDGIALRRMQRGSCSSGTDTKTRWCPSSRSTRSYTPCGRARTSPSRAIYQPMSGW